MSDTKAKGYKGHRVGSKAEKAHKLVDDDPKAQRKDLVAKIKKLGVSDVTAGHWTSVFQNWGKTRPAKTEASKKPAAVKPAPKKAAAAKSATKPAATTKKPATKIKPKTAPVIKPAAAATEAESAGAQA